MPCKVMMDLTLAAGGYAGIPHDTRTTFAMLSKVDGIDCSGLLLDQHNHTLNFKGPKSHAQDSVFHSSRYLQLLQNSKSETLLLGALQRLQGLSRLLGLPFSTLLTQLGVHGRIFKLSPEIFDDYIWTELFAPSVESTDASDILKQAFYGADVTSFQLYTAALGVNLKPSLTLPESDVFLAQRYFPGKLRGRSKLVVRYHDSIPITHPHTIKHAKVASRIHTKSLKANVRDGFFICNSVATKNTLIKLHPQVADRTYVVNCSVPKYFFPDKDPSWISALETRGKRIKSRDDGAVSEIKDYFLCVGTFEPRKNYKTVLEVWSRISVDNPRTKLIIIGSEGWGAENERLQLRNMISAGSVKLLSDVTPDELRRLYSSARAAITASFEEGFSYSGAEAMQCGTLVVASDIACHREIYGQAPIYFDPYKASDLYAALARVLEISNDERSERISAGLEQAALYSEEVIATSWRDAMEFIASQ